MSDSAHDRQANRGTLLLLALAAAATASASLVTVNRLKDAVIDAVLHGKGLRVTALPSVLGPLDWLLLLLSGVACAALVWAEVRRRGISRLLATATAGEAVALTTIFVLWLGHAYLSPGVLLGGDIAAHISRFNEVKRGLEAGHLAFWTNYQYAGAPLLWFTGPLPFAAGGALAFVVRDAVLATKLTLFALHVLTGLCFYALLRRWDVRPVAAALASIAFAGSFAHLHMFLFRGVFPQAFTLLFLVLLFHAADGILRDRGRRWVNVLVFALSTTGIIVNHQPHAVFAAAYLGLFGAVALLTGFWRWRKLPWLVAAGIAGSVASAVAVLPVLAEANWVMIEPEGNPFLWHPPTLARVMNLLVWANTRSNYGSNSWAYLGAGLIVFGLAGVAAAVMRKVPKGVPEGPRGAALPACACLVVSLVLWNPVIRDIIYLLFFAGIAAGLGLDWLIGGRMLNGRVLMAAALLLVADVASTSIQPVFRTDKGFLADAGRHLERIAPDQRVMEITLSQAGEMEANIGPAGGPMSYDAVVQRIAGNHNMAATWLHNYLAVMGKQAVAGLATGGRLAPETRAELGLLNVGRIICASPTANGCPASVQDSAADPVLGRFVPVTGSPILFSRVLAPFTPDAGLAKPMLWLEDFASADAQPRIAAMEAALRQLLRIEKPDLATRTAAALAVQGTPPPPPANADQPWHPVLLAYSVDLDAVRLEVETDQPGYAQLAHPWFPSMQVTVNGRPVTPIRGSIDLTVVPLQPGRGVIVVRDGWTTIRLLSAAVSGAGLILVAGAAVAAARRPETG